MTNNLWETLVSIRVACLISLILNRIMEIEQGRKQFDETLNEIELTTFKDKLVSYVSLVIKIGFRHN